jgi:cytochrome c oxidase subunit II
MKSKAKLSPRWSVLSATAALFAATCVFAGDSNVGAPEPGGVWLQAGVTDITDQQMFFWKWILFPIITAITLFVLALLMWVVVRYNKRANPTPARWSHNTPIEVIWTVVPVLILMFIAIFSFRLLFAEKATPKPDVVVKVTGRQWNWDYAYPDLKIDAYTSIPLEKADADAQHKIYLLSTNNPMVVPVNKNIVVRINAEDVIHSFSTPSLGVKTDAVPGRTNVVWFRARETGTFYGQCSQLCGVNHAYMPIEVKVVSQADFDAWVASKAKPAAPPAPAAKTAS